MGMLFLGIRDTVDHTQSHILLHPFSPFAVQKVQKRNFQGLRFGLTVLGAQGVPLLCSFPGSFSLGKESFMRVQLVQQAKEILGQSDLVMITERVDDVALLIGQMVKMGFVEVLDRHIPRHWTQRGLSWGWTAVIWLPSILPEGDHRKVSMA